MRPTGHDDPDRYGFDDNWGSFADYLGTFVPNPVARRAVSVRVDTDRERYAVDEPVEVSIAFENRLPVPIVVPTPKRRRWGWAVDGELEASDERRYTRAAPSAFRFRASETKRHTVVWDGRLRRTEDRESVAPDPGEHEITAFLATADRQPRDSTTVRIG